MGPNEQHSRDDESDQARAPLDGDTLDHLWSAAHEMLSAMRTLLEAADEFVESQRDSQRDSQRGTRSTTRGATDPREGRVHHIDIDERCESGAPVDADADAS
jgi:hypothetical protein